MSTTGNPLSCSGPNRENILGAFRAQVSVWDIQQRLRVVIRKPIAVVAVEQLVVAVFLSPEQLLQNLVAAERVTRFAWRHASARGAYKCWHGCSIA